MKTVDHVLHSSVEGISESQKEKNELEDRSSMLLSLFEEQESRIIEGLRGVFPGSTEEEIESQLLIRREKILNLVLGKTAKKDCQLKFDLLVCLFSSLVGFLIFVPDMFFQMFAVVMLIVIAAVTLGVLVFSSAINSNCNCDFHLLMRLVQERDRQRKILKAKEAKEQTI